MISVSREVLQEWVAIIAQQPRELKIVISQIDELLGQADSADERMLTFGYTNYRGEYALRTVVPDQIYFGSSEWHPTAQWLLRALDMEKNVFRDFALKDMGLK